MLGNKLVNSGFPQLAKSPLEDYWCEEYFRIMGKRFGYDEFNTGIGPIRIVPATMLFETGNRNLRVLLKLLEPFG